MKSSFRKGSLLFALLFILVSCVGTQIPETPDEAKLKIRVEKNPNNDTWRIYTPSYPVGEGHTYLIEGIIDGQEISDIKVYYSMAPLKGQGIFSLSFDLVVDDNDFKPLSFTREYKTKNNPATYTIFHWEDLSINITREYLEKHREKPIQIKLYGNNKFVIGYEAGSKRLVFEVNIPPQIVVGFLMAFDEHLATQK